MLLSEDDQGDLGNHMGNGEIRRQNFGANYRLSSVFQKTDTHLAGLDGLRAFAVLIVVAFHARVPGFSGGFIGVDVFFVLSGFLITTILRRELATREKIDLFRFWRRRLARLYPALLFALVVFVLVGPFYSSNPNYLAEFLYSGLYLSNYSYAIYQLPFVFRHTWSLSVEMQFYLIWPFAIILLSRLGSGWIVLILITGVIADSMWRIYVFNSGNVHWSYFAFDTRATGLMLGGALAYIGWRPDRRLADVMSFVALLAILACVYLLKFREPFPFEGLIPEIASAMLIVALPVRGAVFGKMFEFLPIRVVGILSYGIYLWHYPLSLAIRDSIGWPMTFFLTATFSTVFAAISYVFIEKYWRKPPTEPNQG